MSRGVTWGRALAAYPTEVRREWRIGFCQAAHARYNAGDRDLLTVAGESEYRRRIRTGAGSSVPAPPTAVRTRLGSCATCGRPGRLAKTLCARCRDAFGATLASLRDLPVRSA